MNAALGQSAVLLSLLGAVAGIVTIVVGLVKGRPSLVRVGRSYTWVILLGAVIATIAMQRALIGHDFSLSYVAHNDSRETPLLFRVTAMWSALEGSILLWSLILAGYLAAVAIHFRKRIHEPIVGWATAVGFAVAAFFFGLMLTVSNPFSTISGSLLTDGPGPDPLLQNHILVAFHPPILYLGLVGFTVPFCFAVASLITGRVGEGWMAETRRWTLFAWAFLSGGIVLGAWWSYQVLGWGGYWAWDPVENAAFIPWLTATAYLHSVMVQQRRGMLRVWNLSLIMATFSLTILGTFLTRSGVLESVHSFSVSSIGPVLLGFFALVVASAVGLLMWRGDRLRSPGRIDSPLSREGAFLANNLLFGAFAVVVLLGTVFPLIAQALNGEQITVGGPYFDKMTMPIVVCLLFLMAIAPVLPWRKASGELLRHRLVWPASAAATVLVLCVIGGVRGLNPLLAFTLGAFAAASALRQLIIAVHRTGGRGFVGRVNGGMIVHLGVIMIAVAFAASHSFAHQRQVSLRSGQSASVGGHTVTFLGTRTVPSAQKTSLEARVRVDNAGLYRPAISQYPFANDTVGTPAVRSTPRTDVYLTLAAPPDGNGVAVIGVIVEPGVMWVWIGGLVVVGGTVLAAFPGRRRRRPTEPVSMGPGIGSGVAGSGTAGSGAADDLDDPDGQGARPVPAGVGGPVRSTRRRTKVVSPVTGPGPQVPGPQVTGPGSGPSVAGAPG
ncbi:MAG: heme lyase CcmF/NrfE family subunit [Actinomycetota bacterium]|nr:heme lyase CcmF/NrfE family subunit [Actinomycetota bacterium]